MPQAFARHAGEASHYSGNQGKCTGFWRFQEGNSQDREKKRVYTGRSAEILFFISVRCGEGSGQAVWAGGGSLEGTPCGPRGVSPPIMTPVGCVFPLTNRLMGCRGFSP